MALGLDLDTDHPAFVRARKYFGRCQWQKARQACDMALRDNPADARATALGVRAAVQLGQLTNEQARHIVDGLVMANPTDRYLEVAAAVLSGDKDDRRAPVAGLRALADKYPGDPFINAALAGYLGCDRATWADAWAHYKVALAAGPLFDRRHQSAAYFLAKREEPAAA